MVGFQWKTECMNDTVRKHFDNLSSTYRGHFDTRRTGANFSFNSRLQMACEMVAGSSGRLLDCASGTGEITNAILSSKKFAEAVVVDISEEMLLAARSAIESGTSVLPVRYLRSDVFLLDPAEVGGAVDLAVCLGLIAHTGRLEVLLTRLKALLTRRTGRILLQTSLADQWGVAITRTVSARLVAARTGYELSYFRHIDIENACKAVGLKIIDARRHSLGIPFGDRVWPKANYWLESHFSGWASKHGAEGLYLIGEAD